MVSLLPQRKLSPLGVDLGSRTVKVVQLSADHRRLHEAARWELPRESEDDLPALQEDRLREALKKLVSSRKFSGRAAVLCLGEPDLFLQNVRVPLAQGSDLQTLVRGEASQRLPFPADEAEIRFIETTSVRQGDAMMREVILMACHRPVLDARLAVIESAGLRPIAVDVEPLAVLRSQVKQFRRDDDQRQRVMFVHIGFTKTLVVIAEGQKVLFVKYLDLGGGHLDEAVARHLDMDRAAAAALRRNNGDRRADQQDAEITRSMAEAIRPVLDRLVSELAMCVRYHSVTFRGQPLARVVVSGGEATRGLLEVVEGRLDLTCHVGDPLRTFDKSVDLPRAAQWDIAAGLALRKVD